MASIDGSVFVRQKETREAGCRTDISAASKMGNSRSEESNSAATIHRRFSKPFQNELLARLQSAGTLMACRQAAPDLADIYAAYQARIRSCNVPARELAF